MFKNLIDWSQKEFRHLPWRKTRSLYGTLVSEIMLQQTTVSTVLNHFELFINTFPSTKELSQASEEEVCVAWKGLGYYRRAKNLRKAAICIEKDHKGKIPKTYSKLIEIDGVGVYTANAILSIGLKKNALPLDANLERVLSRIFAISGDKGPKHQKKIYQLYEDEEILKKGNNFCPRKLSEALMDLGRVFCQSRNTRCEICPMHGKCKAFELGKPLEFAKALDKKKQFFDLKLLRVVVKRENKIFGVRKKESEWLAGQIELPTFVLETEDKSLNQYPMLKGRKPNITKLKNFKTNITKYKILNYIWEIDEKDWEKKFQEENPGKFFTIKKTENFSTAMFKVLERIKSYELDN